MRRFGGGGAGVGAGEAAGGLRAVDKGMLRGMKRRAGSGKAEV